MKKSIITIEEFYDGAKPFVRLFDVFAEKHQLISRARADHICYKCDSSSMFDSMRLMFENESEYLHQSIISGRRIAIIRLKRGIETALGTILFLELSDQKPDGSQHAGYDHVEAYPTSMTYQEMVEELGRQEKVVEVRRPHHTTHDIDIGEGFLFRCTEGLLIEKIKRSEMN